VYQDVPVVWHSQVPQLLFEQRQWKPYYVDLWMGMSAYYWGDYELALRRFRTYHYAILADYDNPHENENKFTSSLWMCKSYIKTDNVFLSDFYCEYPVSYMGITKNVPVSVKYDCLYTCAVGLVRYAEKMQSTKKMIIAHDWLNQTKTLLGYYTEKVQLMLIISDPHNFQSKLNKLEEEKVRKAAEEEKRRQKLKEEYERLDEEYRKQQEEERILEEKRKEYWYQQWKKQEERFANSQRVSSDSTKKTHWKVLGLEPGATAAEIKKAYRQKSLETHPDKVCGAGKCKSEQEQREATEKFREVVAAFEALSRAHTCS
jgi:DnaJ-domain-containing protein 1